MLRCNTVSRDMGLNPPRIEQAVIDLWEPQRRGLPSMRSFHHVGNWHQEKIFAALVADAKKPGPPVAPTDDDLAKCVRRSGLRVTWKRAARAPLNTD